MRRFNLSQWAIEHSSFVFYLMIVSVVAGVFAYWQLGRDEDPPFAFKAMVVSAQWPGATTQDMMLQVTDRIEKKLQETPSLKFIKSFTKPGECAIFVFLQGSATAARADDAWYQVRKKVGDIKSSLPQGVVGPLFDDEFGDTFGTLYAFTADGFTQRELRDYVEDARTQLLTVPGVSKISLVGTQDEKVYIEFDLRQLTGLGIDQREALESLRAQNVITPSGVLQTDQERILLQVSGQFASEESLRNLSFYANNRFYRLSDVAQVRRGYADPPQPLFRFDGESAIGLGVAMVPGSDILKFGDALKSKMAQVAADLPIGIELHLVADQPVVVRHAVNAFMEALAGAVAIVLAVNFVSLGLRAGGVVALSIPLVLALVFVTMESFGIALQRVSLGALVIALGLLVDDAIITIEMMVSRLELGFDRRAAATYAYDTTAFPMLTGTLVTIAGFVPVGFAHSEAGEYTFSLFAVVTIALLISWVVAVLFAPLLAVKILPASAPPHRHDAQPGRFGRMFHMTLLVYLRARYWVIAATLALFALSLVGANYVQQQFFPSSDRPELLVDLTLPQNASIYATDTAAKKLERLIVGDANVDRYSLYVGQGAIRFYLTLNQQLPNEFFAQAVIVTKGLRERELVRARLEKALAEQLPDLSTRIYPLELGPPIGWPLQYRVSGPDVEQLRKAAYGLAAIVAANPDTEKTGFDWNEPIKVVRLRVNQDKARRLGITSQSLAQALNTIVSGSAITQIRDEVYLVDVVVRAADIEHVSLDALRGLQLPLANGRSVPLIEIASLDHTLEQPLIWRRDRMPTITVQADLPSDVQAETVVAQLAPAIEAYGSKLPAGYRIETGGVNEANREGLGPVIAVLPLMAFLMLTILMVQLHSFRRLILVVSVAPLGVVGVVAILLATGTPMGFVAILGIIALSGMIIRNSVILIDQIDQNVRSGQSEWDAVINATVHRMRPILLTAAAAILGMLPIARDVFWGPLAFAVIGGLAGATLLTLLFLPALYVASFRICEPARRKEISAVDAEMVKREA
jgi:multidrug efflux pump subunit AcrB